MKRIVLLCLIAFCMCFFCGCTLLSEESVKQKDLDFVVLGEEAIPQELKTIVEEKKENAFQLTYRDKEALYIAVGYGEQKTGGYSIAVNELYLTEEGVVVSTALLGPEGIKKEETMPSYPYLVLKTDLTDKPVLFQ